MAFCLSIVKKSYNQKNFLDFSIDTRYYTQMPLHPPALVHQLASLRATAQVQQTCACSLHAMIAAILARIFGRLEQLFLLWQSGALPLPLPLPLAHCPAPRTPNSATARGFRAPVAYSPRRAAAPVLRARPRHIRAGNAHAVPVLRAPHHAASAAMIPAYRPHPARAPPFTRRPIADQAP